ncbi:MAG: 6-phosphogluconolactonase [Nannocystaceae bacterium]|nr:6-phosphogluconolactonase [Nannocystaceae bacterium]
MRRRRFTTTRPGRGGHKRPTHLLSPRPSSGRGRVADPSLPTVLVSTADRFVSAAADAIATRIANVIEARGRCRLVLAGGGTPRPIYEALVGREDVAWSAVDFFWGDERAVGPDHEQSNYRMAREALLDPLGVSDAHVFRIEGERSAAEACDAYAVTLGDSPLDVVLLGMGGDGHTASLFPGDPASVEMTAAVVVTLSPKPPAVRISLSLSTINAAKHVVLLVAGSGKAERLAQVWRELADGPQLPAARVRPTDGELLWLLDDAAAAALPQQVIP